MEQTISDGAQLNTLSFDCLSFITGTTCADSFIPPGKVADYFGFQHLRDNAANGMGHNSDFLTFCAFNVISILNADQLSLISQHAAAEVDLVHQYAYYRFPLLVAFRRHLESDHPTDLSQNAVAQFSAHPLYSLDMNITITRAHVFSQVIKSLNSSQIAQLDAMVAGGFSSWTPIYSTDKIDKDVFKGDAKQQIMTYASELFSWYLGDIEADAYFAPERQANYFGSFFFKGAPSVNNRNYTVDEELTADKGRYMRQYVLNEEQRTLLEDLVTTQENDLLGIVESRKNISRQLRLYLANGYDAIHDIDIDFVYEQARKYGEHDGNISYYYTMAFRQIYDSLNSTQWEIMHMLRNLDDWGCNESRIYLYSKQRNRAAIENTDFLFLDGGEIETTVESIATTVKADETTASMETTAVKPIKTTIDMDTTTVEPTETTADIETTSTVDTTANIIRSTLETGETTAGVESSSTVETVVSTLETDGTTAGTDGTTGETDETGLELTTSSTLATRGGSVAIQPQVSLFYIICIVIMMHLL